MEFVLWGLAPGNSPCFEEVIGEYATPADLARAKHKAIAAGYTRLRVLVFDDEAPDFAFA